MNDAKTKEFYEHRTCPHCGQVFRLFELTEVTAVEIWRVDE